MERLRHVTPEYQNRLKDLAILLTTQVEVEYHPSPIIVEDDRFGFDSEGSYHCPSLRTEHLGEHLNG